jgi:hypothetical protein
MLSAPFSLAFPSPYESSIPMMAWLRTLAEYFNAHTLSFLGNLVQGVTLSRSRPCHKNDCPRVEPKNSTLVRAHLGYQRLHTVDQVLALNRLYHKMSIYYNPFQPVMDLVAKNIMREEGRPSRVRRRHTPPAPPSIVSASQTPSCPRIKNGCKPSANPSTPAA